MKGSSMAICPHTGISIPECSCSVCLAALMRRHRPGIEEPEIRIVRTARASGRGRQQRRAA
jgi:hypothetical protein